VLVGFPSAEEVAVLMVGQHDERSALNVYRRLYRDLGIADPPVGERDKPPCCDDHGAAPEHEPIAEDIEAAARAFRRRRPQRT
jgi:hypothetical protein